MFIYQDTISVFLGIRPIQEIIPDFDLNEELPRDKNQKVSSPFKGYKLSEEHKKAFCFANKGKIRSKETREKIRQTKLNSNYSDSEETRSKKSSSRKGKTPFLGKLHSDDTKYKMRIAHVGKEKPKVECPHCKNLISINLAKRWHFDNCKIYNIDI